ncbi:MAG: type II secretion system ATPase GspE [Gammaproteobacteria bacterium]|nr:type II secretion system ATPase GspE [Gammaproteobacteria bacterium]
MPTVLPYGFAKRHGLLMQAEGEGIVLLHRPQPDMAAIGEARRVIGQPFALREVDPATFDQLLARAYQRGSSEAMDSLGELGEIDLARAASSLGEPADLLEAQDDAPIVRLINALLTEAIREEASDIHIETFENRLVVRFRVDGQLREVLEPPRAVAPLITSRIKVMAQLDIAEKRLPQDGRIALKLAGRPVDVRVSTLPSAHGERVVLRLLDKQAGRLDLERLGMAPHIRTRLEQLIHRPHGILLVTGPTGSGKTTTLYAAISRINARERNILTVEDPIEYDLDGVGQTQVNPKVDMTFARGLRAILRQDPDVVMVGEIRDLETAQIAVQASLTGHLVLSTLHTNSAIGAITRLRDMGVEPFLLSSSLIGVVSQRLVRRLLPECREAFIPDAAECAMLGLDATRPPTLYRACREGDCAARAYSGRTGIHELITVDATLARMIHDGSSEAEMEAYVRKFSPSLREDGLRKVMAGLTSLDEVLRVTVEDMGY